MPNIYVTESLPFACYLHTSGLLQLVKVAPRQRGRFCSFAFADLHQRGEQYHAEFLNGAEAPAIALFESLKTLRRFMDAAKEPTRQASGQ